MIKQENNVTVISYGGLLSYVEKAVEWAEKDLEISCEVIDLRSILPLDGATIAQSVRKTGRAVVCREASRTPGIGAELSAIIQEECLLHLHFPVVRVTGYDTPLPLQSLKVLLPR